MTSRFRVQAVMKQTVWIDVDALDESEAEQKAEKLLRMPHRCEWDTESEHTFDEILEVEEIETPRTVRS